jgi:cytochrome P450
MFLAGHETTANALSWSFYLASKHPAHARAVVAEVAAVLGDRRPTFDDAAQLPVTRRFIQEAMRLYPPAWLIARRAATDVEIGGFAIAKGTYAFASPWVSHRHPAFFPDAEGFAPERFEPDALAKLPKYAYFPFGAGPRLCIGQGFAMLETTLVFAMILRRFRLDLEPGFQVVPEPTITLRPARGVRVRLVAISPASRPRATASTP